MTAEYISLISNFIIGTGLLGTLLFYTSKKRKANAEANGEEVNTQGNLVKQYEEFIDTLTQENKDLKQELQSCRIEAREARKQEATERERVVIAYKEKSDALVALEILRGKFALAEWNKCENHNCVKRTPPRTELLHSDL